MSNIDVQTPDSVTSSVLDKTVIPVDKIEHASMSQDESSTAVTRDGFSHEDERPPLLVARVRELAGDFFSEFFATMVMILFGDGVVAQVVLSDGKKGDYQSISWGWG